MRYEVVFIEIGTHYDHVHFLIQSTPTIIPTHIIQIVRSIATRKYFGEIRK